MNLEERLERQKERFKNHVATFSDYGNIKILEFKEADTNDYRIRFLFEDDHYRLHISGDLGELIATNYSNMTFEKFYEDFVHDPGYFENKINYSSRRIYVYDEEKAREDLLKKIEKDGTEEEFLMDTYDTVDEAITSILCDFDEIDNTGVGPVGCKQLAKVYDDTWEFSEDIGKEKTMFPEIYLLAFDLAMQQLKSKNKN